MVKGEESVFTKPGSVAPAVAGVAMVCTRADNKHKKMRISMPEEARFKLDTGDF